MTIKKGTSKISGPKQKDFEIEKIGNCEIPTPVKLDLGFLDGNKDRVLYQNTISVGQKGSRFELLSFERPGPFEKIFFDSKKINVGIVTCGGLCPGLNDVIRSVTYSCLTNYNVKNVYGFKYGYEGLTAKYADEKIILTPEIIDNIHEKVAQYYRLREVIKTRMTL